MFYKIQKEFWSWGDKYSITDLEDKPPYNIIGEVLTWEDKLSFQDIHGNELAKINQLNSSFNYEILKNDEAYAKFIQEPIGIISNYILDIPGSDNFTIKGENLQHEFIFKQSNKEVAIVSIELLSWPNTYEVVILGNKNNIEILCSFIIIDLLLFSGKNE